MSVQVKGSGTIGGLDEGLVVSGIVTSSTQINVGSNIKLGNAGVTTALNFKTGTSNVHSTGYECTNVNATGVITATSFVGSGANLTGLSKQITIGVRSGTAVTFAATGSSFNVVGRSGNIPISI